MDSSAWMYARLQLSWSENNEELSYHSIGDLIRNKQTKLIWSVRPGLCGELDQWSQWVVPGSFMNVPLSVCRCLLWCHMFTVCVGHLLPPTGLRFASQVTGLKFQFPSVCNNAFKMQYLENRLSNYFFWNKDSPLTPSLCVTLHFPSTFNLSFHFSLRFHEVRQVPLFLFDNENLGF